MSAPEVRLGEARADHDEFYRELVRRNSGIVDAEEQRLLRKATVLVAGCGSVGGSAVEPMIRLGVEHLRLAEPDGFELANLNRQRAGLADLGTNKATVLARRARAVNPFARVEVEARGIVADTVGPLVAGANVVLDGVDVTTAAALPEKIALHVEAARARVPVISGYDVAGRQTLLTYDYRRPRTRPLNGAVGPDEASRIGPLEFLSRVVPIAAIPLEIVPELRAQAAGTSDGFPQVVYTADLFGVLATRAVVDLLAGRTVRPCVVVDVHQALRPWSVRARYWVRRNYALARLRTDLVRARHGAEPARPEHSKGNVR